MLRTVSSDFQIKDEKREWVDDKDIVTIFFFFF